MERRVWYHKHSQLLRTSESWILEEYLHPHFTKQAAILLDLIITQQEANDGAWYCKTFQLSREREAMRCWKMTYNHHFTKPAQSMLTDKSSHHDPKGTFLCDRQRPLCKVASKENAELQSPVRIIYLPNSLWT